MHCVPHTNSFQLCDTLDLRIFFRVSQGSAKGSKPWGKVSALEEGLEEMSEEMGCSSGEDWRKHKLWNVLWRRKAKEAVR